MPDSRRVRTASRRSRFFEVLPRLGTTHAEEGFEPFLVDRSNMEVLREFLESHPAPANLNVPNRHLQLYAGA